MDDQRAKQLAEQALTPWANIANLAMRDRIARYFVEIDGLARREALADRKPTLVKDEVEEVKA